MNRLSMAYANAQQAAQGAGPPPPPPPGRGGLDKTPQSMVDMGKDETEDSGNENEEVVIENNEHEDNEDGDREDQQPSTRVVKKKAPGRFYCDYVDPITGEPCDCPTPFTRNSNLNKHKVRFHQKLHRSRIQWAVDIRAESNERRERKRQLRSTSVSNSSASTSNSGGEIDLAPPRGPRDGRMPVEVRRMFQQLLDNERRLSHQGPLNSYMPQNGQCHPFEHVYHPGRHIDNDTQAPQELAHLQYAIPQIRQQRLPRRVQDDGGYNNHHPEQQQDRIDQQCLLPQGYHENLQGHPQGPQDPFPVVGLQHQYGYHHHRQNYIPAQRHSVSQSAGNTGLRRRPGKRELRPATNVPGQGVSSSLVSYELEVPQAQAQQDIDPASQSGAGAIPGHMPEYYSPHPAADAFRQGQPWRMVDYQIPQAQQQVPPLPSVNAALPQAAQQGRTWRFNNTAYPEINDEGFAHAVGQSQHPPMLQQPAPVQPAQAYQHIIGSFGNQLVGSLDPGQWASPAPMAQGTSQWQGGRANAYTGYGHPALPANNYSQPLTNPRIFNYSEAANQRTRDGASYTYQHTPDHDDSEQK
ncbi:hypothetical protein B0T21DRAFT_416795 [Apiosordaria backusii]|uniref:Uncharacterized protein n=1 Tax=Apiosordaria backusii TaxID=314023 RepID=A0AA40DIT7_9PEZI|nr:hypothetical protein B0T21DRAFT_416795 [Apiosordaria backusii]